jgi:hypothetical protein
MQLLHNDYNNLFSRQCHHLIMMVYDPDHEENCNLDEQHLYNLNENQFYFVGFVLHTSHISRNKKRIRN